jgi:outer membrane protein OmpA-like peptidoglycan-associated protein
MHDFLYKLVRARALLLAAVAVSSAAAADEAEFRERLFAETDAVYGEARQLDAEVLAPDAFERGVSAYEGAERSLGLGRSAERIRRELDTAAGHFREAVETAQRSAVALSAVLAARAAAEQAAAPRLYADDWNEAEDALLSTTRALERGDQRRAERGAAETRALYREVELEAIEATLLSTARARLAQARQERIDRLAPVTLSRAEASIAEAEALLAEDRYATERPRALAEAALYETMHARALAGLVDAFRAERADTEAVALHFERLIARAAEAAGVQPDFSAGTEPVIERLVERIGELEAERASREAALADARERMAGLEEELRALDAELGGVARERTELVQRLEAEERVREQFRAIEAEFAPGQARVLRSGDEIILRLTGITFPSGRATLTEADDEILSRVARSIRVFPQATVTVEGHTDASGGASENLRLSRERAEAVRARLGEIHGIAEWRMRADGFGESRPIANNETAEGRAENRRIDVRIEPRLDRRSR